MTLTVINGGNGNGNGAAANGAAANSFRKHHLADALYKALKPGGLPTLEQVRARVSTISKRWVSRENINQVLRHVRDHALEYDWVVTFVQKGNGKHRLYWLQEDVAATEAQLAAFNHATVSVVRGLLTTMVHLQVQAEMVAEADGMSRAQRKKYNKMAAEVSNASTLMANMLVAVTA